MKCKCGCGGETNINRDTKLPSSYLRGHNPPPKNNLYWLGRKNPNHSKRMCGKNNPNYKNPVDRISPLMDTLRKHPLMLEWKALIKDWDDYTCQKCGDKKGGNLHSHHIKYLSSIVKENNIESIEQALLCGSIWDVSNGITLCKDCHIDIHKNKK